MISWWKLLQGEFSMSESTIMLGWDVKIGSVQENELFVKWLGLSINSPYPAVDVMASSFFPILSLVLKKYHFKNFPLISPVVIEIAGLRLLMPRESQKD